MYNELHVHERIGAVITVLNEMNIVGINQCNAIVSVFQNLTALDKDLAAYEQQAKEKIDGAEQ